MVRNARLLIAGVLLVSATSFASAQSWKYDQTPDNTLSYGPVAPSEARAAPAAGPIVADPYNPNDQTPDGILSYGGPPPR